MEHFPNFALWLGWQREEAAEPVPLHGAGAAMGLCSLPAERQQSAHRTWKPSVVPPHSLGGQLRLVQSLRGVWMLAGGGRGLFQCRPGHTDALVFQSEGCGEAQQPQAEVHPVQTCSISSAAAIKKMKELVGAIRLNFSVGVWRSPIHMVSISIQVTKHTCL